MMELHSVLVLLTILSAIFLLTFLISTKQKKKTKTLALKQEPRFDLISQSTSVSEYQELSVTTQDIETQTDAFIDDPLLQPRPTPKRNLEQEQPKKPKASVEEILYIMLAAHPDKPYVGYELLQSLLSAGLRFGAMDLFHRYEDLNGKGKILFSLANASESGTFEINKMGAFSGKGLTLFLRLSANKDLALAFDTMLDTARQLTEDLGGEILDNERKILSNEKIEKLRKKIIDFEQKQLIGDLFDEA